MKTVKVQFLATSVLLIIILSFSSAEANNYNNNNKNKSQTIISNFSINLIHRDSPLSPFYNSSLTPSEIILNAAFRSISRVKHFQLFHQDDAEAVVISNRGDYLMKMSFGSPGMEFHVAADTGSDLVWIPCLPCERQCDSQNDDAIMFDPAKSSTFMLIPCGSQPCASLPRQSCGNSNQCRYFYKYGDNSYTIGDLATETITFGSATTTTLNDDNAVSFPTTVFGCGHDNQFADNTGIAGLGGGALSLISQIGDQINHKFSYCLLPFSSTATSKLRFGTFSGRRNDDNAAAVVSTPLITKSPSTFYYVNLEGITVGKKTVVTGGNIVIDSGTTLTILESRVYDDLRAAVVELMGVDAVVMDPPEPLDLCFRYEPAMRFGPEFVLHFGDGANLRLHSGNMFAIQDDLLCLLVIPSERISILGNIAQINFQVAFDLQENRVSFAPADCTVQ